MEIEEDKDPSEEIMAIKVIYASEIIIEAGETIEVKMGKEIRIDIIEEMIGDNRVNRALSYGPTATTVSVDIVESVG